MVSVHGDLLSVEGDPTLRRVSVYAGVSPSGTAAMEKDRRSSKSDPFPLFELTKSGSWPTSLSAATRLLR